MIYFCGDSHIRTFFVDMWGGNYSVNWFSGATAQGLSNVNSSTNAGNIIAKSIIAIKPNKLYVMFGSVDLDFVLFKKIVDDAGLNIKDYIDYVVDRYVDFLVRLTTPPVVLGIHLPVTAGDFAYSNIANSTGVDVALIKESMLKMEINDAMRASYAIAFNDILGARLQQLEIPFFRIDQLMINSSGLVDSIYVNKPWDHHANKYQVLNLWAEVLKSEFPLLQDFMKFYK